MMPPIAEIVGTPTSSRPAATPVEAVEDDVDPFAEKYPLRWQRWRSVWREGGRLAEVIRTRLSNLEAQTNGYEP